MSADAPTSSSASPAADHVRVLSWGEWGRRLDRPGWLSVLLVGLVCFAAAFGIRWTMLNAHFAAHAGPMPFTLESALQYRMTLQVFEGAGIPDQEPNVQYPEGVRPFEHYSLGAEYLYSALMKGLPADLDPHRSVRWVAIWCFSFGACGVAWWSMARFRSVTAGVVAGLFYGTAIMSVIRSFGLELSRENLGLPLFLLFCAADAWATWWSQTARRRAPAWVLAALAAVCGAAAMICWDLVQLPLGIWLLLKVVPWMLGRPGGLRRSAPTLPLLTVALVACGVVNPYLRAHGFWHGPLVGLCLGFLLARAVEGRWGTTGTARRILLRVLALAPLVLLPLLGNAYAGSYNHFSELLWAKLRYLNVKPSDPALLTYEQRILWTPSLHSATWPMTSQLLGYPLILLFTCVVFARYVFRRRAAWPLGLLCCTVGAAVAYIFFVRFHVFLAFYGAVFLGGVVSAARFRGGMAFGLAMLLAFSGIVQQAVKQLAEPLRWGRVNVQYGMTSRMLEWLREEAGSQPVLAHFGVSGEILTYANCPIVLHPKFETPGIRERVRDYGEMLFKHDEPTLRNWALEHGARYLVYGKNQFSTNPAYVPSMMRYMVDALEPPPEAAARVLEFRPDDARWFVTEWENTKYRIFRVITADDEAQVNDLVALGWSALVRDDSRSAIRFGLAAQKIIPRDPQVARLLSRAQQTAEPLPPEPSAPPASD